MIGKNEKRKKGKSLSFKAPVLHRPFVTPKREPEIRVYSLFH